MNFHVESVRDSSGPGVFKEVPDFLLHFLGELYVRLDVAARLAHGRTQADAVTEDIKSFRAIPEACFQAPFLLLCPRNDK